LLQGPTDAVWGPDDRLYVADAGNHRIQAFDASRAFAAAFAPPAEAVAFQGDLSLAISDSTLFVADNGSQYISAFDLSGNLLRQWGGPGLPDSLGNDLDICCAGDRVFVADTWWNRVKAYDFFGNLVQYWGPDAPGQFQSPESVAADGCGRIYVGDRANRMQCFDNAGTWLGQIGGRVFEGEPLLGCAVGIALFDSNNLVIADDGYYTSDFEKVREFTAFGALVADWDSTPRYYWPGGITVDGAGDVYVSSHWTNTIVKANGQGQILDTWGGTGHEFYDEIGAGTGPGLFRWPSGVACDKAHGWIYVADSGNHRIQKFDTAGNYLLEWSRPGAVEDSWFRGICVDPEGRVFVTETRDNAVHVFDSNGALLTEFGLPGEWPDESRSLRGIAADASGAIYVTDSLNHRVQKFVNPESPSLTRFHSGDQNRDQVVSLTELLRVIQFFNLGGLHCDPAGEDGYAPGLGDASCAPHDSDYSGAPDWQINLSELLRLIQFFNSRAYICCPGAATEDGFAPGPMWVSPAAP
jgi:DNA-binding beta-propeller fold protein YncE